MKIKDGFILRNVAGNFIVVAVGEEALDFNGIITINETGAFLWKVLEAETSAEDLIKALMDEYEVDAETAEKDVLTFIEKLKSAELLAL